MDRAGGRCVHGPVPRVSVAPVGVVVGGASTPRPVAVELRVGGEAVRFPRVT